MLKSGHDRALRQAQGLERSRNGVALQNTCKTGVIINGGARLVACYSVKQSLCYAARVRMGYSTVSMVQISRDRRRLFPPEADLPMA